MFKKYVAIVFSFFFLFSFSLAPVWADDLDTGPELFSESAVLMDGTTGQVLFDKNMNEIKEPASITKIMTAFLAIEKGNMDEVITMTPEAVFSIPRGTSHISLDKGEELTIEQALYAMMVESANDAANGIAEHIGGSLDDFTVLMNEKAQALGAENTHFTNAHGLPAAGHYTSAYDMALIVRQAIAYPEFLRFSNVADYDMAPTNKQPEVRHFHNTHGMIRPRSGLYFPYEGIISGKTGYTSKTGHTLVTVVRRNEHTLIAVVLKAAGAKDAYQDTIKLFDYGFEMIAAHPELSADNMNSTVPETSVVIPVSAAEEKTWGTVIISILKWIASVVLILLGMAFIIRWINLYRRKRRRMKRNRFL